MTTEPCCHGQENSSLPVGQAVSHACDGVQTVLDCYGDRAAAITRGSNAGCVRSKTLSDIRGFGNRDDGGESSGMRFSWTPSSPCDMGDSSSSSLSSTYHSSSSSGVRLHHSSADPCLHSDKVSVDCHGLLLSSCSPVWKRRFQVVSSVGAAELTKEASGDDGPTGESLKGCSRPALCLSKAVVFRKFQNMLPMKRQL